MKKLLFILLFPIVLQSAQVGDTLKYRITYYPTWAYGELDPWNIDWGGLTHVILFSNGSTSTTSPYWLPCVNASDSLEIEFGYSNGATHYLDSLTTICHRKGIKVMTTIQCVNDGANFDYIVADSTRTETFFKSLKGWMVRKHIDGWDLDLESGGATQAQRLRFMRIGRRICYDAAFPSGRALIGIASGRQDEATWTASLVDTIVTFYDMQCYTYQWMWNGNANATWFQTPVNSPASCSGCDASSLTRDALYGGKSFLDGYVANGHDRSKFVVGYAASCVTGFTGTDQLSVAWSNSYADNPLFTVEAMTSYGGTWTHDATAKASYIHGTATAGNPMGFGAGTKFFLPFEDSTDMKAGIDYLKSAGAGGVMFYDIYGDRRVNATPNWKKTPYIYAASVYAARLNGGAVPAPDPIITVNPESFVFGNVIINTTSSEKTYTVQGSNLSPASGNITIAAPTGYEVSKTAGTGFATSITYSYTGGTLSLTTIYTHFRPTAVQSYPGNITNSGGGASQSVAVTGIGVSTITPTLAVSLSSIPFGNVGVGTTSELNYTISGSDLTPASGSITITPPSGYQASLTSGSGFISPLNVSYTGGTLSTTTIYIRFSPTALADYPGTITNAGGGATTQNVAVTGTGVSVVTHTLTVSPSSIAFGNVISNTTSDSVYTLNGSNLTPASGNITITSSTQRFWISQTSGSFVGRSITVPYTGGTITAKTIYVRFRPNSVTSFNATISNAGGGATTQNVAATGVGIASPSPAIAVNPGSLAFDNAIVNTTSSEKTYTVQGSYLSPASGSITVNAPTGYEVSKTPGTGFASSITCSYTGGTLSPTMIYVHFIPTVVQSYPGTITNSGGGAAAQNVVLTGVGISSASAVIAVNPGSLAFSTVRISMTSSEKTYTVQGSNLLPASGNITITAPTGYEVSKTPGTGFASSITCSYTGGTLSPTIIYVHFIPTVVQSYPGTITNSGGGAITQNIALTGTGVSATTSALTVNPTSLSFGNVITDTTSELTYTLTGLNLLPAADSLTITAPSGFTISTVSGSGFTSSKRIAYTSGILQPIPKIIYVRFSPTAVQSYYGTITNSGGSAGPQTVAVSGSGVSAPSPLLTVNPAELPFGNVIINETSIVQVYTLTGSNLSPANGNITITAPAGFQVSPASSSGFNSSMNISYAASTLSLTAIYVRFSPMAVKTYSDTITNSGGGAAIRTVPVSGIGVEPTITVNPLSLSFADVVVNDTSSERKYTLTGSNLTPANGNIVVTASSTAYQISLTTGSGFGSSVDVHYSGGAISSSSPATIFVRFLPTGLQNYPGNITNTGGGATAQNVSVSGIGISATAPLIKIDPTSLSFDSVLIGTPSPEGTYTLSGLHLMPAIDSLTITAPSGFTISTISGSGFTSSKRIAYTGGTLSAKKMYVRFTPAFVGDYSNNITNAGGSAAAQSVYVSGSGVAPTITVSPASLPFGSVIINSSRVQTYTLAGSNLTPANGNLSIKPPAGYQVSLASDSGFASLLNVSYTSSTLSLKKIYVMFSPTAVKSYNDTITNSGGGAAIQNVVVTGECLIPLLTVNSSSIAFGNVLINTASAESTFTIKGSNLTPPSGNIIVTAPSGFEVSLANGSGLNSSINIPYTASTLSSTVIYVQFSPITANPYAGNITNDGGGATTQNVTVSGTGINAAPLIHLSTLSSSAASLSFGSVTINAISREKSYTLSGKNLIAGGTIAITSSKGFQVSATSGAGFDTSISISYSSDTLSSRSIYVLFSPTAVENYNGTITSAGSGVPALTIAVSGVGLPSNEIVQLGQNFPNPFNPYTRIPYSVYKKSWVKLTIFNILGQRIRTLIDEEQDVGYYQPEFDISRNNNGEELSSGIYFYRLEITGVSFTKKLLLLK